MQFLYNSDLPEIKSSQFLNLISLSRRVDRKEWMEEMTSSDAEPLGFDRRMAAIQELIKGKEMTSRLKILLQWSSRDHQSEMEPLVDEILNTFSRSLSLLDPTGLPESGQDLATALVGSPSRDISSGKKSTSPTKDRRGGYRRRRQPDSWTTVPSDKLNDGYTWRKYGQKEIQSTKFPRSYFRCTHRHSQGCQAIKQVQKTEDDPSMSLVMYIGQHTCKDSSKAPQLVTDCTPNEPCIISFGSNTPNIRQQSAQSYSLPPQIQEFEEEIMNDLNPGSSLLEYYMLEDTELEGAPLTAHVAGAAKDHGDVTSSFQSSHGNSDMMSFMAGSSGNGDVF